MRGETDNVVYVNKDGREFVYNSITGELVQNDYNQGSYNYGKYEEPFDKFLLDILPWLKWGNTYNDPTDFTERLYYYLWDLNYGIQDYIFTGRKNEIKKIE